MSADRADLRERVASYRDLAELAQLRGLLDLAARADTLAAKYTAELLTDERTDDEIADIYSAANIARSRARASDMREMVKAGTLPAEYLNIAAEMEQYADERETCQ